MANKIDHVFAFSAILILLNPIKSFSKIDSCDINLLIEKQIIYLTNAPKSNYDSLIYLMRINTIDKVRECYFPKNDFQQNLLFHLIDSCYERSKSDINSLSFLISLYLSEMYNIELREYVASIIPYAVINNPLNYVLLYNRLKYDERQIINGTFVYLKKESDIKYLIDRLDSIILDVNILREKIILEINK
ncbi:hypothetical protein [Candidatus Pollutiaquabacter sp.]|uniref:hypothetical protein n=1 Tax=Candidatus Pollutiaquabacter sp. TaxID=3416354 RepID=UPI003CBF317E|nr:hypothetical protein [Bacteroidota bacterium]